LVLMISAHLTDTNNSMPQAVAGKELIYCPPATIFCHHTAEELAAHTVQLGTAQ